jgi:ketosteroid isomerase-like protein
MRVEQPPLPKGGRDQREVLMKTWKTWAVVGCIVVASGATPTSADEAAAGIAQWLGSYDRAFVAKDLDRLATFYHPDVTIFEGGGVNLGWADYRDHHLGPELREFEGLEFGHENVTSHLLGPDGRTAYVTAEYRLRARVTQRDVDSAGLETLILVKGDDGAWKIRHSHTSSRRH